MKYPIKYFIIVLLLSASCKNRTEDAASLQNTVEVEVPELSDVNLTDAQTKSLGVQFGPIPVHMFSGDVAVNGRLVCPPQSKAAVTAYQGAVVRRITVKEGQNVRRGQTLAYLSHPDFLELQNRYQTAVHRLSFLSQEYQRQKKLYEGKVGAGKDFQQVCSEYFSLMDEMRNISSRMHLLGINLAAAKAGKIVTEIPVACPISGTVEKINVEIGEYAGPQKPMFRIINTSNMYADLLIYEKDIPKLRIGRQVVLRLQARPDPLLYGTVSSIGKTFDEGTKAVHVRVCLNGNTAGLIDGMYVSGNLLSKDKTVTAVSEEGVADERGKSYIFTARKTAEGWTFSPIEVRKGRVENGFVEINPLHVLNSDIRIALNGAYYLMSEMKKAETGEDD